MSLEWLDKVIYLAGVSQELGPPMAYDKKMNFYVTLTLGGALPEAERDPLCATSELDAKRFYIKALLEYLHSNGSRHIVWRTLPEFQCQRFRRSGRGARGLKSVEIWRVYSRLAVYPSAADAL